MIVELNEKERRLVQKVIFRAIKIKQREVTQGVIPQRLEEIDRDIAILRGVIGKLRPFTERS